MEPLTAQQEESLSTDEEEKLEILDSGGGESKISTTEGPPLDKENIEAIESSNISDDSDVRQLSEDAYVAETDFQKESAASDDFLSTEPSGESPPSDMTDGLIAIPGAALENLNVPETENGPFDPSESSVNNSYPETLIDKDPLESELHAAIGFGSSSIYEEFAEPGSTPPTAEFEQVGEFSAMDVSLAGDDISPESQNLIGTALTGAPPVPEVFYQSTNGHQENNYNDVSIIKSAFDSTSQGNVFTSAGIPAPSPISAALLAPPGKLLVPAAVDQLHSQALSALQVLKVIDGDVQPGDLC